MIHIIRGNADLVVVKSPLALVSSRLLEVGGIVTVESMLAQMREINCTVKLGIDCKDYTYWACRAALLPIEFIIYELGEEKLREHMGKESKIPEVCRNINEVKQKYGFI